MLRSTYATTCPGTGASMSDGIITQFFGVRGFAVLQILAVGLEG
jgi:hypothetical protein